MKRLGGVIAAVSLALGAVAFSSAPAIAAPVAEGGTITVTDTTFTAGTWGDGVVVTGVGFPVDVEVSVYVGSRGENGGGVIAESLVTPDAEGNFETTVVPDASNPPVSPYENGFPIYTVSSSYQVDGEYVNSEAIPLTILPGTAITGPAEVDPQALKDGVDAQIVGFGDDTTVSVSLEAYNPDTNEWEVLSTSNQPVVDGAGTVTVSASYTDGSLIEADRQFRTVVTGDTSGVVATWYFVTAGAVAPVDPAPVDPAPVDPAPVDPASPGTTGPVLAETGANDQGLLAGGGFALLMLAAGAGAMIITRRKAALES